MINKKIESQFAEITCNGDRVLMIDLRGKPVCAFEDHVDELEGYGWTVV